MIRLQRIVLASTAIVALTGCVRNRYELVLRPQGGTLDRTLTLVVDSNSKVADNVPEPSPVRALREIYKQAPTIVVDDQRRYTFQGRFDGKTPQDIGGAGWLSCFESPLGSTSIYVERFRGQDDIDVQLYDLRRGADRLVDHALAWLKTELADDPHYEHVRKIVHQDMRQDVRNLCHFWWLAQSVDGTKTETNRVLAVRAAQYLAERNYFGPADWPRLVQLINQSDAKAWLAIVRDALARKAGMVDPREVERSFDFLVDPERVAASWRSYLEKTDDYARILARWERAPTDKRPDPEQVLEEIVRDAQGGVPLLHDRDDIQVALLLPQQPLTTNGVWNELDSQVTWESRAIADRETLPTLMFAQWSEPDADYQLKHFGHVILNSQGLANYVLWYRALGESEMKEWDALVEGFRPGASLRPKLAAFRFANSKDEEAAQGSVKRAADLLLEGVGEPPLD